MEPLDANTRGYLVVKHSDHERIRAWCDACERANRPMVRIEARRHWATVMIDMIEAGWRLSPDAMDEMAKLFTLIEPSGKSWWPVGECFNVLPRVPIEAAETVAARLVQIATACRPETQALHPMPAPASVISSR